MINSKRENQTEKDPGVAQVDTGTVCYVVQYLLIASYFYSHSKVQYVSPLIFNEPSIPGNESKKVDFKTVSLKRAQAIIVFY